MLQDSIIGQFEDKNSFTMAVVSVSGRLKTNPDLNDNTPRETRRRFASAITLHPLWLEKFAAKNFAGAVRSMKTFADNVGKTKNPMNIRNLVGLVGTIHHEVSTRSTSMQARSLS